MTNDRFRRTALATGALALTASVLLLLIPHGPASATALNFVNAIVCALTAWGALHRADSELDAARGWRVLAAAAALQFTYQAIPVASYLGIGQLPSFPSAGDWFGLAVLPTLAIGMLLWPIERGGRDQRARLALEGLLFGGATFFVIWAFGLGQLVLESDASLAAQLLTAGGFALIVADLGVVVYLGLRSPSRLLGPLGWLGAFLLLGTVANTATMMLGLNGRYYIGHPADVLVLLALGAFALAPWSPLPVRAAPWQAPPQERLLAGQILISVPIALALLIGTWRMGHPVYNDPVLWLLGLVLGVGVMARQFLAVQHIELLSRTLETKVHDRTRELAASQEALARAQRLEAIGHMAGGIAHDFNNLTLVISSWAGELRRALPEDHRDQEAVAEIVRASERAANLTKQLLTFARRQPVAPRDVDVPALLAEAEPLLRRLATGRVSLEVRLAAEAGPVFADPTQLEQLLSNLTVNARDAMPDGGTLTIEAMNVMLDGDTSADTPMPPGPYVRFVVADTGTGISEEVMGHIFEPFYTTKPVGQGTGLGLSTCYGIVNRAGGRIAVESRPGQGARFVIDLPMAARS